MGGIEDNKLTVKDLYKEFWECRNFEIDYLRLRSIFLAVFLLAIAAGYGIFVNDHLKEIPPSPETIMNCPRLFFTSSALRSACWVLFSVNYG